MDIKIPKSQNIDPETILILSYQQQIIPELVSEDDTYYYFQIESQSYLATFTIVGKEIVEVQPYAPNVPSIPWPAIAGITIGASLLLVVVLFKAGYIYREDDRLKEELQIKLPSLSTSTVKTMVSDAFQHCDISWDVTPAPVASFDTEPFLLMSASEYEISWKTDNRQPALEMGSLTLITEG